MSEHEKSLGQVAYESFSEEMQPFYTPWSKLVNERGWESAAQAVAARVREECARLVDEFHWILPVYQVTAENRASDDAAEEVREQIARAIRAMNEASHG